VTCVTGRTLRSLHGNERGIYFVTMTTHYVLIDYENVQPASLGMLQGLPVRVMVFVGAKQARVPIDLACSLQTLGDAAEYVKVSGCGKNALDFHLSTLSSTINAHFQKTLPPCDVHEIVTALQREGYISIEGEKVRYHLALA
jgi:hypothetical protein